MPFEIPFARAARRNAICVREGIGAEFIRERTRRDAVFQRFGDKLCRMEPEARPIFFPWVPLNFLRGRVVSSGLIFNGSAHTQTKI